MKLTRAFAALGVLSASCSSVDISTDYDHQANFSKFRTYSWAAKDSDKPLSLADQRIRSAVDQQLQQKGMTPAAPGEDPDVLVVSHARTENQIAASDPAPGFGDPWGPYWGQSDVYEYEEGVLVVDLVDPASRKVVWHGVASSTIDNSGESPKKINEGIAKMFETYPPGTDQRAASS